MSLSSSDGGGKTGGFAGKVGKALIYTVLGGAVHWVCEKAGHALSPEQITGVMGALAAAGGSLVHAGEHLGIHVLGERLGHTFFHTDEAHPTASDLNHDVERVLARAAARTIGILITEWENKIPLEQRVYERDESELDDLRAGCATFLQDKPGSSVPKCVADWIAVLDRTNILEHAGLEDAPWTRHEPPPTPPLPCTFAEFFHWRFPAEFKRQFAEEFASDSAARAKFTLILHQRTLALLGENSAAIAGLRSQIAALSASLVDPNAPWLGFVAEKVARRVLEEITPVLAAQSRTPADLSLEELKRELASRVPNFTQADLDRLINYARFKADIARILKYAPAELIGRDDELKLLNEAWEKVILQDEKQSPEEKKRPHILTFVALGGEGKTSLVAKWAAELAGQDWPGCDAAFAWSFYSQGTREQLAASSDLFLKEALTFFGDDADKEFAASPAGAFEKGQRLARLVGQRRSLLILDGLEPLQYAPTSPTPGQLKDQGIAALLKGLAAASHGLCVVTTRYSLPDLKAFWQTTAPEVKLLRLSRDAGVHLLKTLGVRGTAQEFATLVEDVKGHALTLTLLGTYLRDAHAGDIRKRDLVKLEEADTEEQGGHAFRVMDAYVARLSKVETAEAASHSTLECRATTGQRALAVLRLLGLFDRPATADCLGALLNAPAIPGLTEPLVGSSEAQRNIALKRLEDAKLLTVNRDASGALVSLDAHPHLREYFARQLRTQQPDAWRAAHRRLYTHLCKTAPQCTTWDEHDESMHRRGLRSHKQPTLEELQPLYQAVIHGCLSSLENEAFWDVYYNRIQRRAYYSTRAMGAFGSDLSAIAAFFERLWSKPAMSLDQAANSLVLRQACFTLRSLGRLGEAEGVAPLALEACIKKPDFHGGDIIAACQASELALLLGKITDAIQYSRIAIKRCHRRALDDRKVASRCVLATALHQAGNDEEASKLFVEAEKIDAASLPDFPLLRSYQGFVYHELLHAEIEKNAWKRFCLQTGITSLSDVGWNKLEDRANRTFQFTQERQFDRLSGLNRLTMARLSLYRAILAMRTGISVREVAQLNQPASEIVADLRRAGQLHFVVASLLTRAWLRFLTGARTGPEGAQADLDEAWEIAERGPMKLFMADIHLYRARLFGTRNGERGARNEENRYPWNTNPDGSPRGAKDDLDAAEKLIKQCSYHRRDEELADARAALRLP